MVMNLGERKIKLVGNVQTKNKFEQQQNFY